MVPRRGPNAFQWDKTWIFKPKNATSYLYFTCVATFLLQFRPQPLKSTEFKVTLLNKIGFTVHAAGAGSSSGNSKIFFLFFFSSLASMPANDDIHFCNESSEKERK